MRKNRQPPQTSATEIAVGLPSNANYNEALVKVVADTTTSRTNQDPNGWGLKVADYFVPYNVAALYAVRKQPDEMFEWLQRAWTQHDPNLISNLLSDPFVLTYQHYPRFVALCKEAGLPVPSAPLPGSAGPAAAATRWGGQRPPPLP